MAGRDTPATTAARKAGIEHRVHEYAHDPDAASYGMEAAEALGSIRRACSRRSSPTSTAR